MAAVEDVLAECILLTDGNFAIATKVLHTLTGEPSHREVRWTATVRGQFYGCGINVAFDAPVSELERAILAIVTNALASLMDVKARAEG